MFYKLIFTLFIFSSFCFSSNDIQNLKSFQSKFTRRVCDCNTAWLRSSGSRLSPHSLAMAIEDDVGLGLCIFCLRD